MQISGQLCTFKAINIELISFQHFRQSTILSFLHVVSMHTNLYALLFNYFQLFSTMCLLATHGIFYPVVSSLIRADI